jgi:hypothetical protein
MKYLAFIPTTSGEKLFQYIIEKLIGNNAQYELSNLPMLQVGRRSDELSEYLYGIVSINLLARILKKTSRLAAQVEQDDQIQPYLIKYFQENLGIARNPGDRLLEKLSSLALIANSDSGKEISRRVKAEVSERAETCKCYICGCTVFVRSGSDEKRIQYEHLWPNSYGGNSITENLLPSCKWCNKAKADMLLWQNSHLHSFVLKPTPSPNEWTKIQRRERVAKHRQFIFDIACEKQITLRDAALEIGPMNLKQMTSDDEDDSVDFFNFSFMNA